MYRFNYHKPDNVDAAIEAFQAAEDPSYLSGGMTLIPTMKQRLAMPTDLVDLSGIDSIRGVALNGDRLHIGAFTPHAHVARSEVVQSAIPGLAQLAGLIGDNQVRHRGTIGGSVANSDPAADYPAAVVALGADVVTNKRTVPGDRFFQDLFETALEPGELIVGLEFPVPGRAAYRKFANPASRYAVVGVMVAEFEGAVRVGVTGAGPCAFRASTIEAVLSDDFRPEALDGVDIPDAGFNADLHASAAYRAHLVGVMARRCVADLIR